MRNSAIRKGKIRLLAGIMASLLLSTACLSGVRAAGTEDHMTLHASDGVWKATAEAGETPFPEGAALHIAAGDDTTVAEVRKSIESMDQEESVLKSLNVYEISLSDGDGEPLDYDDEITLTVTDENAVQQDLNDEISCVIYPITEDGESENGLSVGEPVTADAVKLSDAGDLAEFTVKTSLTGKIAAAVYTVPDNETEEQKDEINTRVLDDGETGGNENSDIGISTFAVNPEGIIELPDLQLIQKGSYSPLNNLQIVDNIEGAQVKLVEAESLEAQGIIVDFNYVDKMNEGSESPDDSMYTGAYYGARQGEDLQPKPGIDKYMYSSMCGKEKYGGVSVLFPGSGADYQIDVAGNYTYNEKPHNIYTNPDDDYRWKYKAGWKDRDLDIAQTTMKVTLRYTNAGYYKGKLIDATAEISITPSKNKNDTSVYDPLVDGGYCGIYQPMFQASGSLYRGWVWQNVEQFHVKLTFYEKGSEDPIELGTGEGDDSQSKDAMNADYYVINSLNPGDPDSSIGPEYVLPTQKIKNAYKVGNYSVQVEDTGEELELSSNISRTYQQEETSPTQHAYNGGMTEWPVGYDEPGSDGWAQNSVMIMPEQTNCLEFTMGNMEYIPKEGDMQQTNLVWASISTTPYTQERKTINIKVEKKWQGLTDEEISNIASIQLEVVGEYYNAQGGEEILYTDVLSTITISADTEWKGTFNALPAHHYYDEEQGYYDFRYVVRETGITYTNGNSGQPEDFGFKLGGTTAIRLESVEEDGGTIRQKFELTNIMPGLTIIKKGIGSDGSESPLEGVGFQLQKAGDDWQPIPGETPRSASTGTEGKLVFSNLAEGNYLLTETKTLPGYTLLKEPVKIRIPYTVDASPDTGISYVASKDIVGVTEGNKTKYYNLTYTITNGQSFDMPQTGGTTTGRFMRCGAVLSVTAAGVLLCQRAGRRRWREKS